MNNDKKINRKENCQLRDLSFLMNKFKLRSIEMHLWVAKLYLKKASQVSGYLGGEKG